jgi:hypothetical protein
VAVRRKEQERWSFYTAQNSSRSEVVSGGRRVAHTKGERRPHPYWVGRAHRHVGSSGAQGLRDKCPANFEVRGFSNS